MDYLDKLEAISQGYDDEFKWVDQDFVESLQDQLEDGKELSVKQKEAIDNIFNGGKKQ